MKSLSTSLWALPKIPPLIPLSRSCGFQVRAHQNSTGKEKGGGLGGGEVENGVISTKGFELEALWDDGYGTKSVKDYIEAANQMVNASDFGPPRWFCPLDCGPPLHDSPLLLFLPGLDGVGMGLILHHKALGKFFDVRCLHTPFSDRTTSRELVKFLEDTIKLENASSPNKPIYLVGESLGGCIALAVAARNPMIDLVLVLVNPATSFSQSRLQPLLRFMELFPFDLDDTITYLVSLAMAEPMKMAMVNVESWLPPRHRIRQLLDNLAELPSLLFGFTKYLTKDTLIWKLKLMEAAAAYANSRLHAVKAEVLVLVSGNDNIFPSKEESLRLKYSLENCIVRLFKDNGHALLLEDNTNLLTVLKGTLKYRHSRRVDLVADFSPPSMSEYRYAWDSGVRYLNYAVGSVMLSTMADGKIVKGLAGVPDEGPVLLVGYHMLMGTDVGPLFEAYFKEKRIGLRGLGHPEIFSDTLESPCSEFSFRDFLRGMGSIPASALNIYKLMESKSHVVLYPGGAREAMHCKGEAYKLIWPNRQEFVRVAAKFGAKIVPFGTVGEDDIAEILLDSDDWMKIPLVNKYYKELVDSLIKVRDESLGEVAKDVFIPAVLPKLPGRFYFLFGKPIDLKGREDLVKDKEKANEMYLHVKSEVEGNIAYLLKKRETDPYRSLVDRMIYAVEHGTPYDAPTFQPY